jgi:CRP-like cAMP-binding protein
VFQSCRAFASLPLATLREVFGRVQERTYAAGDVLMRQGDPASGLLVVLEGTASAAIHDADGRRAMGAFTAGDVVGEMALITHEPRTADVIADSPVRALFLPAEAFEQLALRHRELPVVLTNIVAERLGASPRDALGGKTLDRYRIVSTLGRGGMSVVYRARDEKSGQDVALKMMSHRLVYEPGALSRFEREATTVQALHHEHIAGIERLFPAYGTYFLAMELCDGPDLGRLLAHHGRFPEAQVKRIVGQLARALTYVHGMGLVHLDVKPSNVIVTSPGIVKLTDFGVAVPQLPFTDVTRTVAESLLGTPVFMAPEQLAAGPLDARTDIYALGCVAYNMLAGWPPCTATNLLDLVQQKLTFRLPPAEEIGGGIGAEVHEFLEGALQTDRDARLSSLDGLASWAGPVEEIGSA